MDFTDGDHLQKHLKIITAVAKLTLVESLVAIFITIGLKPSFVNPNDISSGNIIPPVFPSKYFL